MSWIVSLLKFNTNIQHIDSIESEEDALPLGTKSEILTLLKRWFPDADFHDPSWISFDSRAELTEIIVSEANELDDNGLIYSLGFRNPSYRLLRDVCMKMGWKALDPSSGDFMDFAASPSEHVSPPFTPFTLKHPQIPPTLTNFIVYLREQVLETWIAHNPSELRNLTITLRTLGDFLLKSGDSTYGPVIDNLAYFAQHAEFADYTLYVPEEATIRGLESRQG